MLQLVRVKGCSQFPLCICRETVSGGGAQLSPEDISKAQKLCKYASSALEYEDTPGAIDYLTQALELLKTAKH